MVIKKRKNPWRARKRNKKYKEICNVVEQSQEVANAVHKFENVLNEVERSTYILKSMKEEYDVIMKNKTSHPNMIDALPIENLDDLFCVEKDGYPAKFQFKDLVRANNIKRLGQQMIMDKQNLICEVKIFNIELLQAKIEALLRLSEENIDES